MSEATLNQNSETPKKAPSKAELKNMTKAEIIATMDHSERPHIVDVMIRERAVKLSQSALWPLYRRGLNLLFGYRRAITMVDTAQDYSGKGVFAYVSNVLGLDLQVEGLENVPRDGCFTMACNHPTGIGDGIAMFDVLQHIRPDMIFFGNSDAERVFSRIDEIVIPVEWVEEKKSRDRTRTTLRATSKAYKDKRAVVIFPSGRLAQMRDGVLTEQEWMPTVASLPKKHKTPIIPVYMEARNSWIYYWFCKVNEELRDMTLFHELLNKRGQTFKIIIGKPIPPSMLTDDPIADTKKIQHYVCHDLPKGKEYTGA